MVAHGAPGQPDSTLEEDGGAPKRGRGVQQHATYSIPFESSHCEHGRPVRNGEGKWRVGKREPNETPDVLTGVGWGIVVGAQESWAHQDED